jgi:hypothetical protein
MRLTPEQREYRREVVLAGYSMPICDGDNFRLQTGDDRTILLVENVTGRLVVREIDHAALPSAVELR